MAEQKARHAYGKSESLQTALTSGTIDAYDILFLDGDTQPKIGWVKKDGTPVIVDNEPRVVKVDSLPTDDAKEGVVYLFEDNAYFWNGTGFVCISKSADLSALEAEVAKKVDEATVDSKIKTAVDAATFDVVEF